MWSGCPYAPSRRKVTITSAPQPCNLLRLREGLDWWTWSGSNRRPLPCHGSALPAAPQAHIAGTLLCLRGTSIILAEVDAIVNASGTQGNPIRRRQTNFLSARVFFRIFPQVSSAIIDCAPHLHNFSKTT